MDKAEAVRRLEPWRAAVRRPAWRSVAARAQTDPGLLVSKFGGLPWLEEGEHWPGCGLCFGPLRLILQIDLDQLPAECRGEFGRGLLQAFACGSPECFLDCPNGARYGFNSVSLARTVEPAAGHWQAADHQDHVARPIELITGWERVDDYPRSLELDEHGIVIEYHNLGSRAVQIDWPEGGVSLWVEDDDGCVAEAISDSLEGDKFGGWPCWARDVSYPTCERCGRRLRLVFQLSECRLRVVGIHIGCGYVWQCPDHKDVLTFSWQN